MNDRKLPYHEGTWFVVPLRTIGYALGVLARATGQGSSFGYFFGPRIDVIPSIGEVDNLQSQIAVFTAKFGDLGLMEGKWPVIGQQAIWDRNQWPLPVFGRTDEAANKAWRISYSDCLDVIAEQPCTMAEAKELPDDGLWGYGAVERRLTRLLG